MRKEFLTRDECTAMRGIAILAIMLHNYCHFIGSIVKENEYQYFTSHNEGLWQVLTHPDALLPVHLLSAVDYLRGSGYGEKVEKNSCLQASRYGGTGFPTGPQSGSRGVRIRQPDRDSRDENPKCRSGQSRKKAVSGGGRNLHGPRERNPKNPAEPGRMLPVPDGEISLRRSGCHGRPE